MSALSTQFRKSDDDAVQRAIKLRDKKLAGLVKKLKQMSPVEAALSIKSLAKRNGVHKDDLRAAFMKAISGERKAA